MSAKKGKTITFENLARCIVNEYRNCKILNDVHNGPRALSHNIRYLFDTITEEKLVYMTKSAARKKPNCELETDHLVPLKVIQERFNKLYAEKRLSVETIVPIIRDSYYLVRLTKKEHEKLNAKGFRSKMPNDWDGKSILARYEAAGIQLIRCQPVGKTCD